MGQAIRRVFLFPGQGAQVPGMVKDVCEASRAAMDCVERARAVLGEDVKALLWASDADTLKRTDRSQLAILIASIALTCALAERGVSPDAVAGFSLGEWSALYAAGVLSFEDVLLAVKQRGEIMQRVCDALGSGEDAPGMAAVMGLAPDRVAELAGTVPNLSAVNFNSSKQTVVAGTASALKAAEALYKGAGARRVMRLAVAGPFHSPLMQAAADAFAIVLEGVRFVDPAIAFFSNVTGGQVTSGAQLKELAVAHLTSPVRWTEEEAAIDALCKQAGGSWAAFEVGPGKTLTGLWKDAALGYPCAPVNSTATLEAALATKEDE